MNFIKVISFEHIQSNDRLSHKEVFEIYESKQLKNKITYYHSHFDPKNNTTPSFYTETFCKFLNVFSRFIKNGDIAIDIGAYDGDTVLPISYLCGNKGKVYAFECGEAFMSKLSINAASNINLNIELIPNAMMPESGVHEFLYCATDYNGGHYSTNNWLGTYTVPRLIKGISFQDFSKDKDLSNLSFIKIDTEGHDCNILFSFKDFIKKTRPSIYLEWFPRTDHKILELVQYLDYKIFCGFTLSPVTIGVDPWRQDLMIVPREKVGFYGLN